MTEAQIRYREYLESDHWRQLRVLAFQKLGRHCYRCPKKFSLEVHHVRYRHPWTLCTVDDLLILCRDCHEKEHTTTTPAVVQQPVYERRKKRKKQRPGVWRREMMWVEKLLADQKAGRKIKKKGKRFLKYFKATAHFSRPYGGGRPHWVNRGTSSN